MVFLFPTTLPGQLEMVAPKMHQVDNKFGWIWAYTGKTTTICHFNTTPLKTLGNHSHDSGFQFAILANITWLGVGWGKEIKITIARWP